MGLKVKDKVVIELLHFAPSCCFNSRLGALVTFMFVIITSYAKYRDCLWRYRVPLYCNSQPQVRLTLPGGNSGLLEVRHKGVWGTVCEDHFGQNEATVFCKMLGFERAEAGEDGWGMVDSTTSRDGAWPIWINFKEENSCVGNESFIEDCHANSLWNHDYTCRHMEDIFLNCKVKTWQ